MMHFIEYVILKLLVPFDVEDTKNSKLILFKTDEFLGSPSQVENLLISRLRILAQ